MFLMTEMKGEQLLFLLWIIQGCTFLPVFHAVSSGGQGLLLALVVRDEQIINFRNKYRRSAQQKLHSLLPRWKRALFSCILREQFEVVRGF